MYFESVGKTEEMATIIYIPTSFYYGPTLGKYVREAEQLTEKLSTRIFSFFH